jgi:lysozyme
MTDAPISEDTAVEMLLYHIERICEPAIAEVKVLLTQNQFDALVSFIYNVGTGNFKKSTLRRKVSADPRDPSIAAEFARWNKGGGKVLPGLVKRRAEEAKLYFT